MVNSSNLPFEILALIASLLRDKDLSECSLVCRKWRQPFYQELWRIMCISSDDLVNEIYSNIPSKKYLINGQHVQELISYPAYKIDSNKLLILQKTFPNIQRLVFNPANNDTAMDWNAWKGLTFFEMTLTESLRNNGMQFCSEAFSQLSRLTKVALYFENHQILSIKDMETIHDLQHLQILVLVFKVANLDYKDMEYAAKATPARKLRTVRWSMDISDLRWLYYVAIKYRNVRELNLECTTARDYLVNGHIKEAKAMISMLPRVFSRLEKLDTHSHLLDDTFTLAFWKCFGDGSFSIKEMVYSFSTIDDESTIIKDIARELVRVCFKTIELIHFAIRDPTSIIKSQDITSVFSYCTQLVYLQFDNCGTGLQFDKIIDYLPSLKELSIFNGKICIDPGAMEVSSPHGLRVINLRAILTDPDTLKYITTRCEYLGYMCLEELNIFGDISPTTGCCLIDMSNARLTELRINALFFKPSCQEWSWRANTKIYFMKIARLTALHPRNTKSSKDLKVSVNLGNDTISTWHNVFSRNIFPRNSSTLITEQRVMIEEYFQDFQVNTMRAINQDTTIFGTDQKPEELKRKLWQGYVLFVCGYTQKYDIDYGYGPRHGERYKWDNIKNTAYI